MVADLTDALAGLDDSKTIVLLQPFDNSNYYYCKATGEKTLTRKGQ